MDQDEQIEVVRKILDRLANDETPQWKRIRKEMQWNLFWPLAKAVFLFWLICVVIMVLFNWMASA